MFLSSREQPIFSARAHVFQIDPATKRNWLPASKHAVTVSFFYDASRSVYRIISVGGTKVGADHTRDCTGTRVEVLVPMFTSNILLFGFRLRPKKQVTVFSALHGAPDYKAHKILQSNSFGMFGRAP